MFALPGRAEQEALLFVKSLRQFGGVYRNADVLVLTLNTHPLSTEVVDSLQSLHCNLHPVEIDEALLSFPFAVKTALSGIAERLTEGKSELLVWMDRDSLMIQEPQALCLPAEKVFGYRPVDHKNIGSLINQPSDRFWQLIYQLIGVEDNQLFAMHTSIDQVQIRPYVNAGMLVVRPEAGLLSEWARAFQKIYTNPGFVPLFEAHSLYRIFIHQAVLAGVLCKNLPQSKWEELPRLVNYPLHMHHNCPKNLQPGDINQIITARYDTFFENSNWQNQISFTPPFGSWLIKNLPPLLSAMAP